MTNKKSNDSRRKLLKTAVAGSGAVIAGKTLPEDWAKPVVDSIVLPVHAETTAAGEYYAESGAYKIDVICAEIVGDTVKIIWVVGGGCLTPQGTPKFRWEGTVPLNGAGSVSLAAWGTGCRDVCCEGCTPNETSKSAQTVMNGDKLEVTIDGYRERDFEYSLPLVNACPSFPALPECTSCDEC